MHPVRIFRFVISGLLLVLALGAAMQAFWPVVIGALLSSGVAALMAIGVHGTTRAEAEAARAGAAWKWLRPWGFPGVDLFIVLMVLFTGWPLAFFRPLDPSEGVADLKGLLPMLKEYRVTGYYESERCTYFAYERGSFITDPESDDCDMDVWDGRFAPAPRDRFDAQASADLSAIHAESERLGQRLQEAFLKYGADGEITGGSFAFDYDTSYVYDPNPTSPRDTLSDITPIGPDWYMTRYESD